MSIDNDVTFPDFPSDAQTPPRPVWATTGEHTYASFFPETGTYERNLSTVEVDITPELTVRLHQRETWDHGVVTHWPLTAELWGREDEEPHRLDAGTARWMGLQLIEHAVRIEVDPGTLSAP